MKKLQGAFGAILAQMAAVAGGLTLAGADPHTAVLVAGGVGVVACEVAVRLFGRGDDGSGGDMVVA